MEFKNFILLEFGILNVYNSCIYHIGLGEMILIYSHICSGVSMIYFSKGYLEVKINVYSAKIIIPLPR